MNTFLTFADHVKDLGSTVLLVAAALYFGYKYLPEQMRQQGETREIIRNNSAVIENCTTVLQMVSTKDHEIKESLDRIEDKITEMRQLSEEIEMRLRVLEARRKD